MFLWLQWERRIFRVNFSNFFCFFFGLSDCRSINSQWFLVFMVDIWYSFRRCGATQSDLALSGEEALDGILGFGKSNSSVISQLASSGRVKKMFAHCLDGTNGGGIFAIGHVVQPIVNTTPLVPNQYVIFFSYLDYVFSTNFLSCYIFQLSFLSNLTFFFFFFL